MREWIALGLVMIGTLFMLTGALGLLRLPDLYTRMSATAKTSTLGVGAYMLAAAFWFEDVGVTGRAMAVIAFVFITNPLSAHMLGRAAYLDGVPLWEGTVKDELKGRYDVARRALASADKPAPDLTIPSAEPSEGTQREPPEVQ
jgi:multicomponent Na+:H+ antiporter subunit G